MSSPIQSNETSYTTNTHLDASCTKQKIKQLESSISHWPTFLKIILAPVYIVKRFIDNNRQKEIKKLIAQQVAQDWSPSTNKSVLVAKETLALPELSDSLFILNKKSLDPNKTTLDLSHFKDLSGLESGLNNIPKQINHLKLPLCKSLGSAPNLDSHENITAISLKGKITTENTGYNTFNSIPSSKNVTTLDLSEVEDLTQNHLDALRIKFPNITNLILPASSQTPLNLNKWPTITQLSLKGQITNIDNIPSSSSITTLDLSEITDLTPDLLIHFPEKFPNVKTLTLPDIEPNSKIPLDYFKNLKEWKISLNTLSIQNGISDRVLGAFVTELSNLTTLNIANSTRLSSMCLVYLDKIPHLKIENCQNIGKNMEREEAIPINLKKKK